MVLSRHCQRLPPRNGVVSLSNYNRKQRAPPERFNLTLKPIEGVIDPRFVKLTFATVTAQATRSDHPETPQVHKSHRLQPKRSLRFHNIISSLAVHPLETRKVKDPASVANLTARNLAYVATCRAQQGYRPGLLGCCWQKTYRRKSNG